jgi:hypothetical protein
MTWEDEHGCKVVMVLKEAVMAYFKVLFTYLAVKIMQNHEKFAMVAYYLSAVQTGYILNTSLICYHINFSSIKE